MFLSLNGTLRTESLLELDKCLNHTDKFERGSEDIFEFRFPPLGTLLSAKIMHDNSGITNPVGFLFPPPFFLAQSSCVSTSSLMHCPLHEPGLAFEGD